MTMVILVLVFQAFMETAIILWAVFYVPRHLRSHLPTGWKTGRRGPVGERGWDAYDPQERRWCGWRHPTQRAAADHAWMTVRTRQVYPGLPS